MTTTSGLKTYLFLKASDERIRWALPGTKPKLDVTVSKSRSRSGTAEPVLSAVPRRLKSTSASASRANTPGPSKSASVARASASVTVSRAISARSHAPSARKSTSNATHSLPPPRSETPQPTDMDIESYDPDSPGSVGTQDPGFDNRDIPTSPTSSTGGLPDDDLLTDKEREQWEEDDTLSVKQKASITSKGSLYERQRAYNIIKNQRIMEGIGLKNAVKALFEKEGGEEKKKNQRCVIALFH